MITAIAVITLTAVSNARAHDLPHRRVVQRLPLKQQINYYKQSIEHAKDNIQFWTKPRKIIKWISPSQLVIARASLSFHKRLLKNATPKYKTALRKYRLSLLPPHYFQFLCIHRYEAAWNDTGDPYWGGLQMDRGFQKTYGAHLYYTKGTANNWTPLEQIWVAERAYSSGRGFNPWPNTARACGLL